MRRLLRSHGARLARAGCLTGALLAAFGARAEIRLNEVLYDPPGADGDGEFVELFADGATDLDGVELWFVNGDDVEGRKRVWSAPAGIQLASGAWYVIGEEAVDEAQATTRLDLQNGPDAVWLTRNGDVLDRLGWGEGSAAEGEPAPDVSGASLGRVPDGVDTDHNATDWQELDEPTPGARNRSPHDFAWVERRFEPTWRARDGEVVLQLSLRATGFAPLQRGQWRCCGMDTLRAFSLARAETLSMSVPVVAPLGRSSWSIEWRAEGASTSSFVVEDYQVGPGSIHLEEVQPRPETGEPEWIELIARDDVMDAGEWAWRDRGGEPRRIGGELPLQRGERLVLTEDPGGLRARLSPPDSVRVVRPESGWATLNDGADERGIADVVELLDPSGVVVDRVELLARDFEVRGRSLERVDVTPNTPSLWLPCPVGHTAGRPNASSPRRIPESGLQVEPNPFTPDGDGVDDALRVVLHTEGIDDAIDAEIRDLAGDRVCRLVGAGNGTIHQWLWDGRDANGRRVPLGAYVVLVRDRAGAGNLRVWRALVAVGGRS